MLGGVLWTPGGVYETNCEADVTYYPLDTQTCSIILSTMSYTEGDIKLFADGLAIGTSQYTENGEWEIISTESTNTSVNRYGEPYSQLHFTFKLRRRPLFHILNTLFPVILMASLTVFVFKLPPESGERVGMSLTVLLAYAVYLTLISDLIPQTSKSVAILSTYLTIILMVSALSVIFTIFVLDVYFKTEDDTEVPEWLQKFVRGFLVRVTCWNVKLSSGTKISPIFEDRTIFNMTVNESLNDKRTNDTYDDDNINTKIIATESQSNKEQRLTAVRDGLENKCYTWKEIALMMDRCFMIGFILMVLIASIVCLSLLVSAHKYS